VISERVVGGVGSFVGFEVAVLPRCIDSQSFSPCRRIGIPVRCVAASCLQRHAQHPPGRRTIVAAAGAPTGRFNGGDAPARSSRFDVTGALIYRLPTCSQPWNRSLFVRKYCFCRSSPYTPGTLVRHLETPSLLSIAGTNISAYNTGLYWQGML
jgi:hypothetical protein